MSELQAWETPSDYAGFNPVGHFGVITTHRDSDLIDRINWDVAAERMAQAAGLDDVPKLEGGWIFEDDDPANTPPVYIWEASHWAVGWVRYMMVRPDAPEALLDEARTIRDDIAGYPILDGDRYSIAEDEEVNETWAMMSVRDRADVIKQTDCGASLFAARRDYVPEDEDGRLWDYLRSY